MSEDAKPKPKLIGSFFDIKVYVDERFDPWEVVMGYRNADGTWKEGAIRADFTPTHSRPADGR